MLGDDDCNDTNNTFLSYIMFKIFVFKEIEYDFNRRIQEHPSQENPTTIVMTASTSSGPSMVHGRFLDHFGYQLSSSGTMAWRVPR